MKPINPTFVIRAYPASLGHAFVAGFSQRFQGAIIKAESLDTAKHFASERAARAYLAKYADLGYGLSAKDATVERVGYEGGFTSLSTVAS